MSTDTLTAATIDGNDINDGTKFSVVYVSPNWYKGADTDYEALPTALGPPVHGSSRPAPLEFTIAVQLLRTGANQKADYRELKQFFKVGQALTETLTFTVTDSLYPEAVSQEVICKRFGQDEATLNWVMIDLVAYDATKYGAMALQASGSGVTVSGSGYDMVVSISGNVPTPAYLCYDPLTAATRYSDEIFVQNNTEYGIGKCPVCITFDHAAEVTAGRSTAAGTDIAVYLNGRQVDCWVRSPNTTSCKVWFLTNLPPQPLDDAGDPYHHLIGAMTDAQTPPFDVLVVPDTILLANRGYIRIDNEFFAYEVWDRTHITITARSLAGSTAAAHSSGTHIYVVAAHVQLTEGTAAVTQPGTQLRPAINLANSDNTGWRWTWGTGEGAISNEPDEAPWGWQPDNLAYPVFYAYREQNDPGGGWDEGTLIAGLAKRTQGMRYVKHDSWTFRAPFRLTSITQISAYSRADPTKVTFALSTREGNGWVDKTTWPASDTYSDAGNDFDASTLSDITGLTGDVRRVAFRAVREAASALGHAGELRVVQLNFQSADQLSLWPSSGYSFAAYLRPTMTIESDTTDEIVTVEANKVGHTWTVVDCAAGEVYGSNSSPPLTELGALRRYVAAEVTLDQHQMHWMQLQPGSNTLNWSSDEILTANLRLYAKPRYV